MNRCKLSRGTVENSILVEPGGGSLEIPWVVDRRSGQQRALQKVLGVMIDSSLEGSRRFNKAAYE